MNAFAPQYNGFNCSYTSASKWVKNEIARSGMVLYVLLNDIPNLPSKVPMNAKIPL